MLFEVVETADRQSAAFRFGQGRKQQRGQDSDDRDDHQQFDEGEGLAIRFATPGYGVSGSRTGLSGGALPLRAAQADGLGPAQPVCVAQSVSDGAVAARVWYLGEAVGALVPGGGGGGGGLLVPRGSGGGSFVHVGGGGGALVPGGGGQLVPGGGGGGALVQIGGGGGALVPGGGGGQLVPGGAFVPGPGGGVLVQTGGGGALVPPGGWASRAGTGTWSYGEDRPRQEQGRPRPLILRILSRFSYSCFPVMVVASAAE